MIGVKQARSTKQNLAAHEVGRYAELTITAIIVQK